MNIDFSRTDWTVIHDTYFPGLEPFIDIKPLKTIIVAYVVECDIHQESYWKCVRCHYCFCAACQHFALRSDFCCPCCGFLKNNPKTLLDVNGLDDPVRVTEPIDMTRYLVLRSSQADLKDAFTIVCGREVTRYPNGEFPTFNSVRAHVESLAHLPKFYHDT